MKSKSDKEIQKEFDKIDEAFDKYMKENKELLDNGLIKPIHNKYLLAQNGICAFIGTMGGGKSFTSTKWMCRQEVLFNEPFFELIVICSTSSKFDETVETFKPLIHKSKLVAIKDTELLDFLNQYLKRILKYDSMIKYLFSNGKVINDELRRLFDKYHLKRPEKQLEYIAKKLAKYNWRTWPHRMLLVLDDFANHPLMRSKETEMCRLLKKLRHFYINTIICVQTAKAITKDIKRTLSDIVLFNGLSREDFYDLIKETPASKFDVDRLWSLYKGMKDPHANFCIYISAGKAVINEKQIICEKD